MDEGDANSRVRLRQHLANQKATQQLLRDELGLPTDDIDEDIKETQRKLARLSEAPRDDAAGDRLQARERAPRACAASQGLICSRILA